MAKDDKKEQQDQDFSKGGLIKTEPKLEKVLIVAAKRDKFRRAGFEFGAEPKRLRVRVLTKNQIDQLKAEPMLVVTETTVKDEYNEIVSEIASADPMRSEKVN